MKSSIQLILASGIVLAGNAFSQSGPPVSYSGGPTSGISVTATTTTATTVTTGVITVPTTPVVTAKMPTAPIVNRAPQQIAPIRIQPVVQKPDMTAILRDQAGNVQALRGINGSGKPEFQPNGTGTGGMTRKPAIDPKPTLGSLQMMNIGVGNVSLGGLKPRTGSVRYETRTVTRPIARDKTSNVTEGDEEKFDLKESVSESAIMDLLKTDVKSEVMTIDLTVDENVIGNLIENVGEKTGELQDLTGIDFNDDNRVTDDLLADFGGIPGPNNGYLAPAGHPGANNDRFKLWGKSTWDLIGGFSGAVDGRVAGNAGRGDVSDGGSLVEEGHWVGTVTDARNDGSIHEMDIEVFTLSKYNQENGTSFTDPFEAEEHGKENRGGYGVIVVTPDGKSVTEVGEDIVETTTGTNRRTDGSSRRTDLEIMTATTTDTLDEDADPDEDTPTQRGLHQVQDQRDANSTEQLAAGVGMQAGYAGTGKGKDNEKENTKPEENNTPEDTPEPDGEDNDGEDNDNEGEDGEGEDEDTEEDEDEEEVEGTLDDWERTFHDDEGPGLGKGPVWAENHRRRNDLIRSKATNGVGNTIRMGENGERAGRGPLEKGPTHGNKGFGTIRTDRERLTRDGGNLELLERKLNDPTIRSGGEDGTDPRNKPKPDPAAGGNGSPPISPGVITRDMNFNSPAAQTVTGTAVKEIGVDVESAVQNIQLNQNLNVIGN